MVLPELPARLCIKGYDLVGKGGIAPVEGTNHDDLVNPSKTGQSGRDMGRVP